MSLHESVAAILADASLDDEADARDSSRVEELEKLILVFGWEALEVAMLTILASSNRQDHWQVAAGFFWGAVLDHRPLDRDRLIAHLCFRFTDDDDTVWSITCKLKSVDYLSDYDPRRDPAVQRELDALQKQAHSSPG